MRGSTYFLVDMKNTEGIDIRPLKEITGDSLFNEVYFDGALLPPDAVVGRVDEGWQVARNTLGNERVHMADQLTFDTGLEALIARAPEVDGACWARSEPSPPRRTRSPASGCGPPCSRCRAWSRGRARAYANSSRPPTSRRSPSSPSNCSVPKARCAKEPVRRACTAFSCRAV